MRPIARTLSAAVIGFAVGAGAVSGGLIAYDHLNPSNAIISKSKVQTPYATVASYTPPTLPLGPDTISNVVKRDGPAVVKIVATVPQSVSISSSPFFNPFFGSIFGNNIPMTPQTEVQTDIGSGFFINSRGYLLTNDHVIHGATKIQVYVPGYSKPFNATRVGTDYATDLAVLKISAPKPLPYLVLGNSNQTPVGAWAIAIGNPYDLSHTVTVGVISAKGRPLTIGNRHYRNLLQTSAAINPGNSGGPLLNLAGQVVGINTAVSTQGQGIGFAIPTSTVEEILPQLMKYGHVIRPWLGVFIGTDSKSLAQQYGLPTSTGVVIAYVEPNSPAQNAGLYAGEVITAVNGQSVTSASQLKSIIDKTHVGQNITITVNDQGRIVTRNVTIGQEPNGPITEPSTVPSF
ncbi:S1C family serine protease [Sulfobacillus thermosulfidooxidans]|uniref:S1C family serine protease n=1 Tax=Sulfobacillus thermosulfidooxidans TaxID=28034 RepID=UPI00096BA57D|nr:trypsin-like peptidase domain-containing protein [Sulfobacillus thermosulfidooxidans]OLZ08419.1 peptidase A2 [Sulfobacillus thermosulfidooxidans]OLZ13860.1 peptidase A2 [Sulfobacillus thermosulfidooxidans]OLZ20478.1 peptidase A2 [Sulfobacillus thermosulfidooxidans]